MNFADFPVGPFFFSTGGIIFTGGVIVSAWILTRMVHEKGLSLAFLSDRLILFGLVSFVFGRIGAMGRFWSYFTVPYAETSFSSEVILFLKKFFLFWHGGIDAFWTGIGFLLIFFTIAFLRKESLWKWLDAFVLPTIVLLMFWELGAFFSGWDYGRPVQENFPIGVTYDLQSVRYSVPLHPVQLYSFFYFAILLVFGFPLWRKHFLKRDGTFFGMMTLLVFLGNGILEFFRGDPTPLVDLAFFEMRFPQLMSFIIVIILLFFLIFHTHQATPARTPHAKKEAESAPDATTQQK
jgi:prolipoprotein diacylglyceryltransferase